LYITETKITDKLFNFQFAPFDIRCNSSSAMKTHFLVLFFLCSTSSKWKWCGGVWKE